MNKLDPREFGFLTETERYDAFVRAFRLKEQDPASAAALEALYDSPDPLMPLIALQYLEELPEKAAVLAIVRLIERDNEIVSKAAMAAYQRNHYPGKPRLLKQLVLSKSAPACRFAVRMLSRAAFMEILPLILRELPEREGAVRLEMLEALRFLPDRRSAAVVLPLADSPDEAVRFLALQVLVELQARTRALPVRFFLKRLQDSSERVRRAAVEALQRFPSQRVIPLILEAARDESAAEAARVRAVRALGSFPSAALVRPLAALSAEAASTELRLSAEIALRHYPASVLRQGFLPLFQEADGPLRRQAALLAAELIGRDDDVEAELLRLWRDAASQEALALVDALRALGTPAAQHALASAVRGPELLAYPAATALAQMRGAGRGAAVLELARDPDVSELVKQALLDRFARRGPDDDVRAPLAEHLRQCLRSPNDNLRYLAARALAFYPLSETLDDLLELLSREDNAEIARVVQLQLLKGLGRDPLPFARAAAAAAARHGGRLRTRALRVLGAQGWDRAAADALLDEVANPPHGLLCERPDALLALLVRLLSHGSVDLLRLWPLIGGGARLEKFLRLLAGALRSGKHAFPALGLDALEARLPGTSPAARALFYEVLAADGGNEAAERLASALARETDAAARAGGSRLLKALLQEAPR